MTSVGVSTCGRRLLASWPLIAATAPVKPATVVAKIIDSARSSRPWSTAPENHAGYTIGTCVMSPPLRTAATRLSQIGQAGSGTREPAATSVSEKIGRESCRERVSVRVDLGGRRSIKKKTTRHQETQNTTEK